MLHLGPHTFSSRLIVGTGKYPDFATMQACHEAAGADLVTVALRRVDLAAGPQINVLDFIDRTKIRLLPNTAGCYTADDAVETARIARELLGTDLIKLEVIGDPRTLWPDTEGTLEAARILVKEGFTVLPYCPDDPVTCQRLEDIGCAAVMPSGRPDRQRPRHSQPLQPHDHPRERQGAADRRRGRRHGERRRRGDGARRRRPLGQHRHRQRRRPAENGPRHPPRRRGRARRL
jgi:hypothetical protein